ncbi:MAG TPA: hypothetical protein VIT23_11280 [Terrimicrobiaceae bacterium]
MKELEISQLHSPAPSPSRPRYRYFSSPPATLSLRLAEFAAQIPDAARLPGFNPEHSVTFSCEEIFTGPAPKLSLSRLAEIAAEHVQLDGVADQIIRLPVAQLALGYRFVNGRELIEEPKAEVPNLPRLVEAFAPKEPMGNEPKEGALEIGKSGGLGEGSTSGDQLTSRISQPPLPPEENQIKGDSAKSAGPRTIAPEVWRPITVFPTLRRKVVEPQVKPPVAPIRPVVEVPQPRAPSSPDEFPAKPKEEAAGKSEKPESPPPESLTPASQPQAILVETEHLSKIEPSRTVKIADQDLLQAVFMTEEMLTIDRVVELCGGLPGIKSCVLAHGAAVLASYNVPDSIDLVSLSAHALEMLDAMRQSAARMGVGAVPAVTIHAEKGPITFLHHEELCLLVMHKDRGFVPGVREKLQQVVDHLSQPNAIAGEENSRLAWTPSKTFS